MTRTALTLAVLTTVVLTLMATSSSAYELLRVNNDPCSTAQNLFWSGHRAVIDTHFLQPSAFATYAIAARDQWNGAVGSFQFVGGSGSLCNPNDGITSMIRSQTVCGGSGFGDAVSITVFRFNSNGAMIDADVSFDSNDSNLTDPALFTQIAMHELGHVLGLAHSDACGGSGHGTLMQAVTPVNEPRLTNPQPDDIAGALAIYPGGSSDAPAGNTGCAITSAQNSSPDSPHDLWRPAWELVVGAAALVLVSRPFRRRPQTFR